MDSGGGGGGGGGATGPAAPESFCSAEDRGVGDKLFACFNIGVDLDF